MGSIARTIVMDLDLSADGCARSANAPKAPRRDIDFSAQKDICTGRNKLWNKIGKSREGGKGSRSHIRTCRWSMAVVAHVAVGCVLRCPYVHLFLHYSMAFCLVYESFFSKSHATFLQ